MSPYLNELWILTHFSWPVTSCFGAWYRKEKTSENTKIWWKLASIYQLRQQRKDLKRRTKKEIRYAQNGSFAILCQWSPRTDDFGSSILQQGLQYILVLFVLNWNPVLILDLSFIFGFPFKSKVLKIKIWKNSTHCWIEKFNSWTNLILGWFFVLWDIVLIISILKFSFYWQIRFWTIVEGNRDVFLAQELEAHFAERKQSTAPTDWTFYPPACSSHPHYNFFLNSDLFRPLINRIM